MHHHCSDDGGCWRVLFDEDYVGSTVDVRFSEDFKVRCIVVYVSDYDGYRGFCGVTSVGCGYFEIVSEKRGERDGIRMTIFAKSRLIFTNFLCFLFCFCFFLLIQRFYTYNLTVS